MKDYKKILEGVMNIINTTEKSDIGFVNICAYIGENCPELKESEDERIRKKLIEAVKGDMVVGGTKDKQLAIAWLEKQGEKKHAAWSEEDEEIRNNCIYWLEKARKYFEKDEDLIYDKKWIVKCTDWLKYIRPQNTWKPSDVQLDALHDAAVYVYKSMSPYPKGILMKLYKQLKKLREE